MEWLLLGNMVEGLRIGCFIIEARPMPIAAPVFSVMLLGVMLLIEIIVIVYVINVSVLFAWVIKIPVLVPPVGILKVELFWT